MLSRRNLLLSSAALVLSGSTLSASPGCTLVTEQEVGPYYVDDEKLRRDITEGKPGLPLKLRVVLVNAKRCVPLANAALDVWHCDALGVYSGFTAMSPDGPPGGMRSQRRHPPDDWMHGPGPGQDGPDQGGPPPGHHRPPPGGRMGGPIGGGPIGGRPTDQTRYLRGVQLTDRLGVVEFETIYPGWYSGRSIHIHLKIHLGGKAGLETYAAGHVCHTGQLFFPEEITDSVAKLAPYAKRISIERTLQSDDHVFTSEHGNSCLLSLTRLRKGTNEDGFLATATIAVDPDAVPAPVGGFGRPDGPQPDF